MAKQSEHVFEIKTSGVHSMGSTTKNGFVVRADSIVRKEMLSSIGKSVTKTREELINQKVLVEDDGQLRLTQDHLFPTPSSAAGFVTGRSSNGWTQWKDSDGRTLSDVKRITREKSEPILSEILKHALVAKKEELLNEGKLYSIARYERCYALFRERFGPQVLQGLDGEALLTFMHDMGNRDSLVYWLEFKNDDEFDTKRLGSIAGGQRFEIRDFSSQRNGYLAGSRRTK